MASAPSNFDPLARIYRALEWIAFGGDLERARFCLLDTLSDRRSILVLGEGDGRCVERLLTLAPDAEIHCLDASPAMIARAKERIAPHPGRDRVTFENADAFAVDLSPGRYDAVVTLFFLDCFTAEQAKGLVGRASAALKPQSRWLFADFVLPAEGIARVRARAWLALLYAFFRWTTGLQARALPPSKELIEAAGFAVKTSRTFQWGLLEATSYKREKTHEN